MTREVGNTVRDLVARRAGHAHLVGICGVGMAGLANLLKAAGLTVSGCDLCPGRMARWLTGRGIEVREGHDIAHVERGVDWVVRSAAVPPGAPEIVRAAERGLPVFVRGEALPELLRGAISVAVAGTHGKTSTSSFIAQVLQHAGRKPSWCIGGEVAGDATGMGAMGPSERGGGDALVVEADESDGTLALYAADIAVVTNIELDHMEHFHGEEDLMECFRKFAQAARRKVVFCADDPRAARLCSGMKNTATYGFSEPAYARALDWREEGAGQSYRLEIGGLDIGRVTLPFPGRQYALNSLAAVMVARELGLTMDEARAGLGGLRLPSRRFEKVADRAGATVISDYAHHPTEIAAVVGMTPVGMRRLAIFQPHRYTRTLALGPEFPRAFDGVDELVLTPVYAASEKPLRGGSVWDLYRHFREYAAGKCADSAEGRARAAAGGGPGFVRRPLKVSVAGSLEQAWGYFRRRLRPGDALLLIGAGDVEKIGEWAKEGEISNIECRISNVEVERKIDSPVRRDEPLADKTTLKVGGAADLWAEAESVEQLTELIRRARRENMPFHVMGGGSNVLASDLGVRGLTMRLTGKDFRSVREGEKMDSGEVIAGAGVSVAALLDWLERRGWAGLEFLEGIPGTLGGALRMNAGAWGGEIGRHISWIRCLNPEGAPCIVPMSELGWGYRECGGLEGKTAIEAGLRLSHGDSREIRKRREEIAAKREWMKGLRSAGSVFKNPPDDFAGRLIEQAGLKGLTIGGASVSTRHANVIATQDGATASDVRALMEIVRAEVAERFGVTLEPEIVMME